MLKEITIENFKSLEDVTIDLTDYRTEAKNLVVIYGESGSGKSNIVEAIHTLKETVDGWENLYLIYTRCRREGAERLVSISTVICLGEDKFCYCLQFGRNGLVYDVLDNLTSKNKGTYFVNTDSEVTILNNELKSFVDQQTEAYEDGEGKYSFLYYLESIWKERSVIRRKRLRPVPVS